LEEEAIDLTLWRVALKMLRICHKTDRQTDRMMMMMMMTVVRLATTVTLPGL